MTSVNSGDVVRRNLITRVNVGDMLTRSAARAPRSTAVVDGLRRWTWAELDEQVNRLAGALRGDGYEVGDRLAVMSGNNAEFLITYYACAKAGLVCVPINLGWRGAEIIHVLRHSRSRALVVTGELVSAAAEPLSEAPGVTDVIVIGDVVGDPVAGRSPRAFADLLAAGSPTAPEVVIDDRAPLQCLYTSGTTSAPKGVVGSHLAVYLESLAIAVEWRFSDRDRIACTMPLFHTAQLNLFCTPAVAIGAGMVLLPGFEPERLLSTIEEHGISIVFGLPMMYRMMLDLPGVEQRTLDTLRLAVYGMAPMPDEDLRRAMTVFDCDFSLMFGQTEMSPVTTIFRPEHQLSHSGAVGTPTVNTQVAIMDTSGVLLGRSEVGEIVYRGPQTMSGYLNDDDATDTAFAHGWFHSGDVGHFDDDDILWFDDRRKDVIKTGGENVASIEVERALYAADPAVGEVAVIGLPHQRWSEAITAVVVAKPGAHLDADALRGRLHGHLDGYKIPKSVIVLDELPKTSTGKIQKHLLRADHAAHYAEGDPR